MAHSQKAIVITGGTKRLGFEFAKKSLEMGYSVVLHYRTEKRGAEAWLKKNPAYSSKVFFYQADLRENSAQLISAAKRQFPGLCGLINNISIYTKGNMKDIDHFKQVLHINSVLPAELTKSFCSKVKKGWIINITDANIDRINIPFQNYRISKKLLEEITYQLASIYAPHFRVNAIAPGAMLPAAGDTKKEFLALKNQIPLKKVGDLNTLMQACSYLISNTYVTGQVLYVDGGWHLK